MESEPTLEPERPEADSLDQQRPAGPAEPEPEPASQSEASDGDLADQARAVGPDEYHADPEEPAAP